MTIADALEYLEGHGILNVELARKVCTRLHAELSEEVIISWKSREEAWERLGFVATREGPDTGVDALLLSYDICEQLGIDPAPGHMVSGKGFASRLNQQAIARVLAEKGLQ